MSGAWKKLVANPVCDGQEELAVCFASPFLLSRGKTSGNPDKCYVNCLVGMDLSAAFSKGLTRRLKRKVELNVQADPLSLALSGKPRIISVRRAPNRLVTVPAFSIMLTLRGSTDDIRAAYFAGLGEKTRYGFGCAATLN